MKYGNGNNTLIGNFVGKKNTVLCWNTKKYRLIKSRVNIKSKMKTQKAMASLCCLVSN